MNPYKIVAYKSHYKTQLIILWRESKYKALKIEDRHDIKSYRQYLESIMSVGYQIRLALLDGEVVGFIAYHQNEIHQLYVKHTHFARGIGGCLLTYVQLNHNYLTLKVIQKNEFAILFYKKHGFKIISSGFAEEEQLADFTMKWLKT